MIIFESDGLVPTSGEPEGDTFSLILSPQSRHMELNLMEGGLLDNGDLLARFKLSDYDCNLLAGALKAHVEKIQLNKI
jgi:hypothetical protein